MEERKNDWLAEELERERLSKTDENQPKEVINNYEDTAPAIIRDASGKKDFSPQRKRVQSICYTIFAITVFISTLVLLFTGSTKQYLIFLPLFLFITVQRIILVVEYIKEINLIKLTKIITAFFVILDILITVWSVLTNQR